MPTKYLLTGVETLNSTADSLQRAVDRMREVSRKLIDAKMTEAYLPWTPRQQDCADIIIDFSAACETVIESQLLAQLQGRPSRFEMVKVRSARDMASRKLRQGDRPAKPLGRPRKNPAAHSTNSGAVDR